MSARRRVRAYIGLGANLGDAPATLAAAVQALDDQVGSHVRGVSRLYATAPWGMTDQPEFRNAVVAIDVERPSDDPEADALALLASLKRIEREGGRQARARWGPRELDLDLLVYGRHRIDVGRPTSGRSLDADLDPAKAAKRLEVPHRDLGKRLFVLAPLGDLAPQLVPPGWSERVSTRRDEVARTEPAGSVRVVGEWDAAAGEWRAAVKPSGGARPRS
jgi:2-amino-4-hydroxy-6-hydroxymethyldihydropteridine diphosphokinase